MPKENTTDETTEETTDESTSTETTEETTTESEDTGTESETSENSTDENTDETTESTDDVDTKSETDSDQTNETEERVVPEVGDYVLPEGVPEHMAQFAKDNDFTQSQLDASVTQFAGYVQASRNAEQLVLRESGDAHAESWGEKKDYNLSLVRRALKQNDPDGKLTKMLDTTGYGNHPEVLNFFLRIGTSMKEGGFMPGAVHRPKGKTTAAGTMFGKSHPSAT